MTEHADPGLACTRRDLLRYGGASLAAGLPSDAEPLRGWQSPKCEPRGFFAGGR
jgi:hypothetical protein